MTSRASDCLEASAYWFALLPHSLPTLQCPNSQALCSGARNTKLTDVVVSPKEITMEAAQISGHI